MKLEHKIFDVKDFASEMAKLKTEKHFDFLVTIVGEDFGEEGLGCIYILENTGSHERTSVKVVASDRDKAYIPTVSHLWKGAEILEREVYDFFGIIFLGNKDMRRLYLRSDFKGYPFRKDFKAEEGYSLEDDNEPDYTMEYSLKQDGTLQATQHKLFTDDDYVINIGRSTLPHMVCSVCRPFSTEKPYAKFILTADIYTVVWRRCVKSIHIRKHLR